MGLCEPSRQGWSRRPRQWRPARRGALGETTIVLLAFPRYAPELNLAANTGKYRRGNCSAAASGGQLPGDPRRLLERPGRPGLPNGQRSKFCGGCYEAREWLDRALPPTSHKIPFAPLEACGSACHPAPGAPVSPAVECRGIKAMSGLANARPTWQSQPLNRVIGWIPV